MLAGREENHTTFMFCSPCVPFTPSRCPQAVAENMRTPSPSPPPSRRASSPLPSDAVLHALRGQEYESYSTIGAKGLMTPSSDSSFLSVPTSYDFRSDHIVGPSTTDLAKGLGYSLVMNYVAFGGLAALLQQASTAHTAEQGQSTKSTESSASGPSPIQTPKRRPSSTPASPIAPRNAKPTVQQRPPPHLSNGATATQLPPSPHADPEITFAPRTAGPVVPREHQDGEDDAADEASQTAAPPANLPLLAQALLALQTKSQPLLQAIHSLTPAALWLYGAQGLLNRASAISSPLELGPALLGFDSVPDLRGLGRFELTESDVVGLRTSLANRVLEGTVSTVSLAANPAQLRAMVAPQEGEAWFERPFLGLTASSALVSLLLDGRLLYRSRPGEPTAQLPALQDSLAKYTEFTRSPVGATFLHSNLADAVESFHYLQEGVQTGRLMGLSDNAILGVYAGAYGLQLAALGHANDWKLFKASKGLCQTGGAAGVVGMVHALFYALLLDVESEAQSLRRTELLLDQGPPPMPQHPGPNASPRTLAEYERSFGSRMLYGRLYNTRRERKERLERRTRARDTLKKSITSALFQDLVKWGLQVGFARGQGKASPTDPVPKVRLGGMMIGFAIGCGVRLVKGLLGGGREAQRV